ncbi:hypothetical protein LFL96_09410 [Paraburkholderia sp. D15]|uniref:hypothetical protein n=1 Tax=Paraburkholderia sp. D15 TaxID=2880218 RepID=UPI00247B2679|nr:hypothetical protein [Paraburkholderia sp. D15]WGS51691.1 hypothetical protein LFL96_09410 [Paraburkholderia sp. D15]
MQQEAFEEQGLRSFSRNVNAPSRKKRRMTITERICYLLAFLCALVLAGMTAIHFMPDPPANIMQQDQ